MGYRRMSWFIEPSGGSQERLSERQRLRTRNFAARGDPETSSFAA